jgi:hypothetical protein
MSRASMCMPRQRIFGTGPDAPKALPPSCSPRTPALWPVASALWPVGHGAYLNPHQE